jgi:hypothetical protein
LWQPLAAATPVDVVADAFQKKKLLFVGCILTMSKNQNKMWAKLRPGDTGYP